MNRSILRIGERVFSPGGRTSIMGILNVTPDSFSDGGAHNLPDRAFDHAESMVREGATVIDIGGESTRPGATAIDAGEEWQRISPVLKRVGELKTLVSVDTQKAEVALKAVTAGAHLINDIWGLQGDPAMAGIVADSDSAIVIMHNRHEMDPDIDIIADIHGFFEKSLEIAKRAGVRQDGIVLDPGIGFGKSPTQNEIVLNRLREFRKHGYPLLVGASRKRFIGSILGADDPHDRLYGTLGAHLIAVAHGAEWLRVHDVKAHMDSTMVAGAILNGGKF